MACAAGALRPLTRSDAGTQISIRIAAAGPQGLLQALAQPGARRPHPVVRPASGRFASAGVSRKASGARAMAAVSTKVSSHPAIRPSDRASESARPWSTPSRLGDSFTARQALTARHRSRPGKTSFTPRTRTPAPGVVGVVLGQGLRNLLGLLTQALLKHNSVRVDPRAETSLNAGTLPQA
jgi:hypothetical protein